MKALAVALAAVLLGLALFEITMRPSSDERMALGLIFVMMAVVMTLAAVGLPRVARRSPSIRITVAMLSLTSFVIVAGGAVAIASRMFISQHDLTLLLVILAFGAVSALGFAVIVSRPMTIDLNRLSQQAADVADGSLDTRVSLDRHDELGRLGTAIDRMIARLDAMEAERTATLEARKAFFAAIGHDLRTPLASLRAAVEAMQDGLATDTDRFLDSMDKDIAALSHLVDDVFLLARLDTGVLELTETNVDIGTAIDEAIEVVRPIARSRRVTVVKALPGRAVVRADAGALGRVLRNLLENAIRHAPIGSQVSVQAAATSETVTVRVDDEGTGFERDFVALAFDRFTREDPARGRSTGGSGLGLAIASSFVTAMDGEIWAGPGPGGRVGFRLPRPVPGISRPMSSRPVLSGTARADFSGPRR